MQTVILNKNIKDCTASVVAIGKFDGFHLGHRAIVLEAKKLASKLRLRSCGLVVILGLSGERFLTPRDKLMELLKNEGLDFVTIFNFHDIKDLSCDDFVKRYLIDQLKIKGLVSGSDFRCGKNAHADCNFLKDLSKIYNFEFISLDRISKYSSTNIKELLKTGEIKRVKDFLGRDYAISGEVYKDRQLAREFGYPTANILVNNYFPPKFGSYVVSAKIDGFNSSFRGVANIGMRPTVYNKDANLVLETHIFNFSCDIYNRMVEISFIDFIREEKKFNGLDELKKQIGLDAEYARNYKN